MLKVIFAAFLFYENLIVLNVGDTYPAP